MDPADERLENPEHRPPRDSRTAVAAGGHNRRSGTSRGRRSRKAPFPRDRKYRGKTSYRPAPRCGRCRTCGRGNEPHPAPHAENGDAVRPPSFWECAVHALRPPLHRLPAARRHPAPGTLLSIAETPTRP